MRMITYTVNDLERVVWLESIGVDAVITDAVDRIAA
jgi:glycerophosphoryl diester phosphodiesterase